MLEDLDCIDWASLTHAYGPASDVPDLLRALLSKQQSVREEALSNLYGNVWHQGTVYPATLKVIPFLSQMLLDDMTPDKTSVACLLATISAGQGYYLVHAPGREGISQKILREQGTTLEEELDRERTLLKDIRTAVSPSIPLLFTYLDNEEDEVRYQTADALGYYPEHAEVSLPQLRRRARLEPEEHVKEMLVESIKQLEEAS